MFIECRTQFIKIMFLFYLQNVKHIIIILKNIFCLVNSKTNEVYKYSKKKKWMEVFI